MHFPPFSSNTCKSQSHFDFCFYFYFLENCNDRKTMKPILTLSIYNTITLKALHMVIFAVHLKRKKIQRQRGKSVVWSESFNLHTGDRNQLGLLTWPNVYIYSGILKSVDAAARSPQVIDILSAATELPAPPIHYTHRGRNSLLPSKHASWCTRCLHTNYFGRL